MFIQYCIEINFRDNHFYWGEGGVVVLHVVLPQNLSEFICNLAALKAAPQNPGNLDIYLSRSQLYEELGEKKKALEGYKSMLKITPPQDGERYMEIARTITKVTPS